MKNSSNQNHSENKKFMFASEKFFYRLKKVNIGTEFEKIVRFAFINEDKTSSSTSNK